MNPLADAAPAILGHFNDDHSDLVDVIGGYHVSAATPEPTELVAIDPSGFTAQVRRTSDGIVTVHIPFRTPVTSLPALRPEIFFLAEHCRNGLGIAELTSVEHEQTQERSLKLYVGSVHGNERVSPRMRRISVGGEALRTYRCAAPDQWVRVLGPPRGRTELTVGSEFRPSDLASLAPDDQPSGATYTVRSFDRAAAVATLIVVDHGPGSGSDWARDCNVGEPVGLWGPRSAFDPPTGTDRLVLIGDETAAPAIAAVCDACAEAIDIVAVIETSHADEVFSLHPEVYARWLVRSAGQPPGEAVLEAVDDYAITASTYVFGGGESRSMTRLRKHVRTTHSLPARQVCLTGYWR